MTAHTHGSGRTAATSDLAVLVDTEARLDRALAGAREAAAAAAAAARRRAAAAAAAVGLEIERDCARIAAEIGSAAEAQRRALVDGARAQTTRFDAVRGEPLTAIARALARRLAAIALDEAGP